MEIIINRCYGGFEFSDEAIKEILKRKFPDKEITTGKDCSTMYYVDGEWFDDLDDSLRTDPIAIQVVKELGDKADGEYADLKIVEIPDGVEYTIEDYDGIESIHEVHRVWC